MSWLESFVSQPLFLIGAPCRTWQGGRVGRVGPGCTAGCEAALSDRVPGHDIRTAARLSRRGNGGCRCRAEVTDDAGAGIGIGPPTAWATTSGRWWTP